MPLPPSILAPSRHAGCLRTDQAGRPQETEQTGSSCGTFVAHRGEKRCSAGVSLCEVTKHKTADRERSQRVSVALIIRRSSVQVRGDCARSTAAKYSSGATLRRYALCPGASLTCSTPVGDNLASGSGRRGRRFKSACSSMVASLSTQPSNMPSTTEPTRSTFCRQGFLAHSSPHPQPQWGWPCRH